MAHADGDSGHNIAHDKLELLGALGSGYAQVTAIQSGISTGVTDLTSLAVTVTVTSGRRIRVSCLVVLSQVTSPGQSAVYIFEGATQKQTGIFNIAATGYATYALSVILTPSAGSHTYKLCANTSGGTVAVQATATAPAYVLVEDIGV